jgi:hypothetical protein
MNVALIVVLAIGSAELPTVSLDVNADGRAIVRVSGADAPKLAENARVSVKAATEKETDERPALAGRWIVNNRDLIFEPRFPLTPGVVYQVALQPEGETKPRRFDLSLPEPDRTPITSLRQIYPTRDQLPENQLRFYLEFSGPMKRGQAYKNIQLLDEKNKPIPDVFLEIDEELWNPAMTRLTLLFDPGRVKNGLKPREDLGPTLENGKKYTLRVSGDWPDAEDRKLTKREFRKPFTAGPPDITPIDPKTWKLQIPRPGTRDPLVVSFGESLDYALLTRVIGVADKAGQSVEGAIAITNQETCWQFTPPEPWQPGAYQLIAKTILEDLAANRVGRAFEVDVFNRVDMGETDKQIAIPFAIKRPE